MERVVTGLEAFLAADSSLAGLARDAKVALVAHPASVDSTLRHAADLIVASKRLKLVRLFAPEHGVRGEAQDMEAVAEPADPSLGVPVVSLYGADEASLRPRVEHLAGLDAIVYDLQDVGSRYYTFVVTLSYVMEAARVAGIPVVVLDRPNPIGGEILEGPVLEPRWSSFVGRYPIPVRHAMTTAELARLFNDEFGIGCDLRVVEMRGWRRTMHFEDTGLPWVLPSPNMPTPDTARVYPGGCLIEGTNLSEGRGTTRPFELFGAPWLDASRFASALDGAFRREGIEGVTARAAHFRPMFQKHARTSCQGAQLHVTDRTRLRSFGAYLVALREARDQDPSNFGWREQVYEFVADRLAIDLLLGRTNLRPMLEASASLAEMEATWRSDLAQFEKLRSRFLLYPD